jgi:two-component system chemotaxis sensor kinase CheA
MAKDPYKYFRVESRELLDGLTQGILQLEKGAAPPDVIQRLLRLAHTLKGAARVVKQPEIAERAHAIEDVLTSHRETGLPLTHQQGSDLLRLLDEISARVKTLEPGAEGEVSVAARVSAPAVEEPIETLRVEIEEMDVLLRCVTEVTVQLGAARKGIDAADRLRDVAALLVDQLLVRPGDAATDRVIAMARSHSLAEELASSLDRLQRDLTVDVERVSSELGGLHDVAHRLRLTPARTVFQSLDRAVRDAAQALGKRVDFEGAGGDIRLDASVLLALRDALTHVVRNAVTHGIESAEQRVAAGKPAAGQVRLEVDRRGSRVAFVCRDDGRGVDVEAVKRAAVARGLISSADAQTLSSEATLTLLRTGGLTTSAQVTELSGRGIGLDVARATAAQLKGELNIRSESGRGTTVELIVPVTIASMQALVVEVAGTSVAIPLDSVRQTLRVTDADLAHSTGGSSILYQGNFIPFLPLDRALQRVVPSTRRRRIWSAVVIESDERTVAVGVDRLDGTASIVMRALPGVVEADPVIAGASLDAEGNPQLVLDPSGLVAAADGGGHGSGADEAEVERAPILVIDDSLTTRMMEQSILESAGYEVELATSAEDGLAKAQARRYSLFIVDVEMPGMDGFEFVALTRADPVLREISAILVTSRNAVEDRQRGAQVGASAYIVKGEFDQGLLLRTIRGLIG